MHSFKTINIILYRIHCFSTKSILIGGYCSFWAQTVPIYRYFAKASRAKNRRTQLALIQNAPRSHPFRLLYKLPGNVLLLYNRGRRDRTRISFQSANDISFAIIHHSCIRLITSTSHLDGHCTSTRPYAEKVTLNGRINFPVRVLNNLNMRPIDFRPRDRSYFASRVNDFN